MSKAGTLHILSHLIFRTTLISSILHLRHLRARSCSQQMRVPGFEPRQSHACASTLHLYALLPIKTGLKFHFFSGGRSWPPNVIMVPHLCHSDDIYCLPYVLVIYTHSPPIPPYTIILSLLGERDWTYLFHIAFNIILGQCKIGNQNERVIVWKVGPPNLPQHSVYIQKWQECRK